MIKTLKATVKKVLQLLQYPLYVALERVVSVDHTTVRRWVIKLLPMLGKAPG